MRNLLLIAILFCNISSGKTIYVGKSERVTTIKAALGLAVDGDTIIVRKGIYKEDNIKINKQIVFIGQNHPTLDGQHKFEVLSIAADSVVVKGFRIINSGHSPLNDPCGIKVYDRHH